MEALNPRGDHAGASKSPRPSRGRATFAVLLLLAGGIFFYFVQLEFEPAGRTAKVETHLMGNDLPVKIGNLTIRDKGRLAKGTPVQDAIDTCGTNDQGSVPRAGDKVAEDILVLSVDLYGVHCIPKNQEREFGQLHVKVLRVGVRAFDIDNTPLVFANGDTVGFKQISVWMEEGFFGRFQSLLSTLLFGLALGVSAPSVRDWARRGIDKRRTE